MNEIVAGSISEIAQAENKSIAEAFVMADVVVIVDTSSSMAITDEKTENRYELACKELKELQKNMPGKIAVVSFSDEVEFCPSGIPSYMGQNTDLAKALRFCKMADVADMRFILISDGEPDNGEQCLQIAKTYKNKIDVIYIGSEISKRGRSFLEQLASASGGRYIPMNAAMLEKAFVFLLGEG